MKSSALMLAALLALPAGAALAQTTTTTTTTQSWTPDEGATLTQSWTTNKYTAPAMPNWQPAVGMEVPATVTAYPLPESVAVPDRDRYSYTVIDNRPVVFEKTTRKVVHTW